MNWHDFNEVLDRFINVTVGAAMLLTILLIGAMVAQ